MAKIQFTAFLADARNKLNGNVFSKNRYGSYVRNKVTPVNPRTTYQQNQRQMLGNLSSSWRGLTEAQRQAWRTATQNFPQKDIFGQTKFLAGNVLFISLNKNLINAGQSTIDDPPAPVAIPELIVTDLTAAAGTPAISFDITPTTIPTGFALFVKATPNVGPGRVFVKNLLRFIGVETATTGSVDITNDWTDRFGTPVEGQRITVQGFLVSETTGQAGVPSETTAIVSA